MVKMGLETKSKTEKGQKITRKHLNLQGNQFCRQTTKAPRPKLLKNITDFKQKTTRNMTRGNSGPEDVPSIYLSTLFLCVYFVLLVFSLCFLVFFFIFRHLLHIIPLHFPSSAWCIFTYFLFVLLLFFFFFFFFWPLLCWLTS